MKPNTNKIYRVNKIPVSLSHKLLVDTLLELPSYNLSQRASQHLPKAEKIKG